MELTTLLDRVSAAGVADLMAPATVVLKATIVLLFAGLLAYAFRTDPPHCAIWCGRWELPAR